MMNASQQSLLC